MAEPITEWEMDGEREYLGWRQLRTNDGIRLQQGWRRTFYKDDVTMAAGYSFSRHDEIWEDIPIIDKINRSVDPAILHPTETPENAAK